MTNGLKPRTTKAGHNYSKQAKAREETMKRNEIKKLAQEKIKKTVAIHIVDVTLPRYLNTSISKKKGM